MKPLVSIILPVKDGAEHIVEALNSVAQAAKEYWYEIIVINDGSTDETERIVQESGIPVLYFTQSNQGAAAARNYGLQHAQGEYIAYIDADDVWTIDHLTTLMEIFYKRPAVQIALGYSQRFISTDADITSKTPLASHTKYGSPALLPSLGCALILKDVFASVGVLEPKYHWHEDVDWYLRARELGIHIAVTKKVVKYYRLHAQNTTRDLTPTDHKILHVLAASLGRRKDKILPSLESFEI